MMLIDNIGTLVTLNDSALGEIADAVLLIDDERVFWCGPKKDCPKIEVDQRVDATGCVVMPGLVDCHSHLIFAGSRADEFALRMKNETYQSIMQKGGGIMSTVNATRRASDEELLSLAKLRADKILRAGVTTLEAKSGYGLSLADEVRILRLLRHLNQDHLIDIHATFLGAHVVPVDFKSDRQAYVSLIANEMLEQIAEERLAIDCDVFCEEGAFSVEESALILSKAHALGLGLRAHVQQLSHSGGVSLVNDLPIKSISHADFLSDQDIDLLASTRVVVEALPIAGLFLRSRTITPVSALRKRGVALAIATDFNPGSAMCNDLVLAARLGVTYYGFSFEDAVLAITKTAAQSLGRVDIGVINPGCLADILITNCSSVKEFFYDWTKHPAKQVIKRGALIEPTL